MSKTTSKTKRGGRSRTKKRRYKNNNKLNTVEPPELSNAPHSFIFHRGVVGSYVMELMKDFRKVMEPYTASSLKAKRANTLKDFVSVAGVLHVTHMCVFTSANTGNFLKIGRIPQGPTLYFKILNYCLSRDVVSSLKKQVVYEEQYKHSPLVILNCFSGEDVQLKLMTSMFQNMFPSINVTNVNLNTIRRCVLFNYDPERKEIDFRHFAIKVVPVGLSKGIKKIVTNQIPDLSKYEDISEFISKGELLSESEAEEDTSNQVILPQKISSRGNMASTKSSIRLIELGPRMTLQLVKIEEGLMTGEVLFHSYITKTEEEKEELRKLLLMKKKLKEKAKKVQKENVIKKEELKKKMKEKSLIGMRKGQETSKDESDNDDDREWFVKEVGTEPEKELFDESKTRMKRKKPFAGPIQRKKLKKMKSDLKTKQNKTKKNKFNK